MSLSLEQAQLGSFTLGKPGLAIGSTASQLAIGAAFNFCIDGVIYNKGSVASFALAAPSTAFNIAQTVPAGYKSAFAVWVDSAGALTVTQSAPVPYSVSSDKAGVPPNPGGRNLVGVAVVTNPSLTANGGFRPGTDNFNATVTTNYYDTFSLQPSGLA